MEPSDGRARKDAQRLPLDPSRLYGRDGHQGGDVKPEPGDGSPAILRRQPPKHHERRGGSDAHGAVLSQTPLAATVRRLLRGFYLG